MAGSAGRESSTSTWIALELYLAPDLVILGGGVSKEMAKFAGYLTPRAPIRTAMYLNTSGIIGAAYAAAVAQRMRRALQAGRLTARTRVPRREAGSGATNAGEAVTPPA